MMQTRQRDRIDADEVKEALQGTALAGEVRHFEQVVSTSDLALQAAQAGQSQGVWIADAQTGGRGRGKHSWASPAGDGLYMSALFTPRLPASTVELSLAAGLAAWEAIRDVSGLLADLRWPNDIMARAAAGGLKLGGILTEAAISPQQDTQPSMLRYVVIGIGLNVAHRQFPPELAGAATSLYLEGWQEPDRQRLLISILQHLCWNLRELEDAHVGLRRGPDVLSRVALASTWIRGKHVRVAEDGGYTGVTAGLDPRGYLLVNSDDGVQRTVRSGGVRELFPGEGL